MYTHYLRFNKEVAKRKFSKASADIKKAFELIKAEFPNITIKDGRVRMNLKSTRMLSASTVTH